MKHIDTKRFSIELRNRAINKSVRKLLITNLNGSNQENDLTKPTNCNGFGRLRHFRRNDNSDWINPLPIDPALRSLGKSISNEIIAQVFQNAICNWRCWYCFVDFNLLSGDQDRSGWLSAEELVQLYLESDYKAEVIDLSGGQPDLIPEWSVWMVEALQKVNLEEKVYLWSDDNLSNDYFTRYLSQKQIDTLLSYPHYGRVGCFKGFDDESFSFNTQADPSLFKEQFNTFRTLLNLGFDMYAYVTFTHINSKNLRSKLNKFADDLQFIHPNLPLRTVPLKVEPFSPCLSRITAAHLDALTNQEHANGLWKEILNERFDKKLLSASITDIKMP